MLKYAKDRITCLQLLCVLVVLASAVASCGVGASDGGTITIVPQGNRLLSGIKIQKCERQDDGSVVNLGGNYATETTIDRSTSYPVDPGPYYVFLKYDNLDTGASGWWQTTTDALIDVAKGEEWVITYGYSGANVARK